MQRWRLILDPMVYIPISSSTAQALSDADQVGMDGAGVPPFPLGVAVGEVELERGRVRIDDDVGTTEALRGFF